MQGTCKIKHMFFENSSSLSLCRGALISRQRQWEKETIWGRQTCNICFFDSNKQCIRWMHRWFDDSKRIVTKRKKVVSILLEFLKLKLSLDATRNFTKKNFRKKIVHSFPLTLNFLWVVYHLRRRFILSCRRRVAVNFYVPLASLLSNDLQLLFAHLRCIFLLAKILPPRYRCRAHRN